MADGIDKMTKELQNSFAAALTMAGGATPDDSIFYRGYNSLHRLDYFNPNVANNIHIFMTRPKCNFNALNIAMDTLVQDACWTAEGSLILASLMKPYGVADDKIEYTYDSDSLGKNAYSRLKEYGLAKLGSTPFIPLVSNLSTEISGIKDIIMEKYEYDGDQAGNKTADPMGVDESQSSGECTISYIESSNNSISVMHLLWMIYMDKCGKGLMNPDLEETLTQLIYDYESAIYWFVTGQDGFSIKWYGKLTGVFPLNVAIGSLIPSRGSPTDPKVSFSYHYNHSEQMNPEIINDFNFTIDEAVKNSASSSGYLENDPVIHNPIIREWMDSNFKTNPKSVTNETPAQAKYQRYMETKENTFEKQIFYPSPQNQWSGHPYVYNGRLVYRSIGK